jgi:hypothetical protein
VRNLCGRLEVLRCEKSIFRLKVELEILRGGGKCRREVLDVEFAVFDARCRVRFGCRRRF